MAESELARAAGCHARNGLIIYSFDLRMCALDSHMCIQVATTMRLSHIKQESRGHGQANNGVHGLRKNTSYMTPDTNSPEPQRSNRKQPIDKHRHTTYPQNNNPAIHKGMQPHADQMADRQPVTHVKPHTLQVGEIGISSRT